ncbi:polyribonucleotide 5'-hydroxyl-kinase Clp1 [Parasteatoda tepidariorum]|uniref:polyribonucleotide 5'-hydroxyl-kinase Clp1 n=1 Tax=Parasteatoda tepidariorum TaxID=114398 RepID=UPI001C7205C3|nr:polyribonucleotide 5'-hydroxyl-kinase Clp1 [Parasteatoda tepidariorum]
MGENAVFKLEAENELRVMVGDQTQSVEIELIDGLAEIYGTEMQKNKVYAFPKSSSISVFSWQGCSIKVTGAPQEAYIATDTYMILHVILHACLEQMRIAAENDNRKGPVTLVVGPADSGKSSLCRLLLNYAARLGRKPFLIDLDVGQNSLSIPGTINILNVDKPADIVDGFDQEAIQAYHFGYKSPGQMIALYFLQIKKLGEILQTRLRETNRNARTSGVIIDTCGWTRGDGYNALTLAAMSFQIDKLVVVQEERLYTQLKRDMPSCVEVLYMPKMLGVNERTRPVRIHYREKRVKEYFYGSTVELHPHTFEIHFSEIKIYQVTMKSPAPDSSVGVSLNDIGYSEVALGPQLINQVLALSSADKMSDDAVLKNIIGFICVRDIDLVRGYITILSPQPAPLPKKILFLGDIELIM